MPVGACGLLDVYRFLWALTGFWVFMGFMGVYGCIFRNFRKL